MHPFLARTMVESLSKGINLVTGLPLSDWVSCANAEVQDVLIEVLVHCAYRINRAIPSADERRKQERSEIRRDQNKKRYPCGGEPWTKDEETRMMSLHRSGCNIYQIANVLKRTSVAVADRIKKFQNRPIYRSNK